MLEVRVRLVLELGGLPHHVQEVAGIGQVVVRVDVRQPDRVPVGEGGQSRDLGDQADDLQPPQSGIGYLLGVRVEGRQRADARQQHAHRVRIVVEPVDELLDRLVDERVMCDFALPHRQLRGRGQFPGEQQIGDFQEAALVRQFRDRKAAVAQDAGIAVDEGDRTAAARRVRESRIVGHQTEVALIDLYRTQGVGADRAVLDRDLIGLAGAVVSDGQGTDLLGHAGLLSLWRSHRCGSCRGRGVGVWTTWASSAVGNGCPQVSRLWPPHARDRCLPPGVSCDTRYVRFGDDAPRLFSRTVRRRFGDARGRWFRGHLFRRGSPSEGRLLRGHRLPRA